MGRTLSNHNTGCNNGERTVFPLVDGQRSFQQLLLLVDVAQTVVPSKQPGFHFDFAVKLQEMRFGAYGWSRVKGLGLRVFPGNGPWGLLWLSAEASGL